MKHFRKTAALCLALLLLAALPAPAVKAAEAPYQAYDLDSWNNPSAAPNAYVPERAVGGAQMGCGDFNNPQDLFYCPERHEIFVSDSGNGRIVVLDEALNYQYALSTFEGGGESVTLKSPYGVFVQEDGTIYIADMGLQQVIEAKLDGTLVRILPTPVSDLLPANFNYLPTKVIVDNSGRIYILSRGIYQGIIYLEADGSFIKFFGPNDVEMTFRRRMQAFWKKILPEQAAASMQSFNPIEYSNMFLSPDGYIYATAAGSENGAALFTKLNPLGIDCNPSRFRSTLYLFSDAAANGSGIVTLLDTQQGRLLQFDEGTNSILFQFGGIGKQLGLFQKPVSLIEVGSSLYVLDADKKTITEFVMSEFGLLVREAIDLYDAGLYEEAIEPWKAVLRRDSNFNMGYVGLGLAYYQLKDYKTAMYYFGLQNDRADYSAAWKEYSLEFMRNYFTYIVLGIVVLIIVVPIAVRGLRDLTEKRRAGRRKAVPAAPGEAAEGGES